ncbi:MAG: cytochrome P450 [Granulosicoccus sp.]|nr:cytochrome P450 [Granulosicoccus sp.]
MKVSSDPSLQKRPPGPATPFDINVDEETFHNLARWRADYGDIIQVEPVKRTAPAFVLNNPDHVRHVLIGNHRNYTKGVGFERVKMLLGNGIIVSDGDFWRSQRRMVQPMFHKQVIGELSKMMQRCNQAKLADWKSKAAAGQEINITVEMSELALEVVLRALFSSDLDELVADTGENPFNLLVQDPTRDLKFAMRFRQLTQHVQAMMNTRRETDRTENDFLSMLMLTVDKDNGNNMPDKAIIDEVMTIIVAGHETTAGTLNWVWYLLSQHPDIEARLHAEVDALPEQPGIEHLPELSYTRQIVEEALRLYPPVWLYSRKAIDTDQLGGYSIPAGADIFLCPYLLHRDPAHWKNPELFDPDRFSATESQERNRYAFYPFSLGSRRCVGEFFSMVDMQLHMALLARSVRLTHSSDKPVAVEPHINLRTKNDITMGLEIRPHRSD